MTEPAREIICENCTKPILEGQPRYQVRGGFIHQACLVAKEPEPKP